MGVGGRYRGVELGVGWRPAVFLWEARRSGGAFEGLLLRLGGKPGIASERDGPYLLLRGLVRLLNYEVTKVALEEKEVLGKVLGGIS